MIVSFQPWKKSQNPRWAIINFLKNTRNEQCDLSQSKELEDFSNLQMGLSHQPSIWIQKYSPEWEEKERERSLSLRLSVQYLLRSLALLPFPSHTIFRPHRLEGDDRSGGVYSDGESGGFETGEGLRLGCGQRQKRSPFVRITLAPVL